jgi:epoxyqueuosine reductase
MIASGRRFTGLAAGRALRHGAGSVGSKERIVAEARRLGFDAVAIARADLPLDADFARYESFVEQGMHGGMDWLARSASARRRLDGDEILFGARSVICLARKYGRSADEEDQDPELARSIARYARGRDYHNGVRKKLRTLAKYVRKLGTETEPVHARPLCDQEPVLERAWAARAGLGFVGKNGLLIVPGVGSLVLLGEVVTTLVLEADPPIAERCGACTRCLDACPTAAFVEAFVLDPRRCVAYLTIENRDSIPEPLREGVGTHLFGCDDCQTVCPFNARSRAPAGTGRVTTPAARSDAQRGSGSRGMRPSSWATAPTPQTSRCWPRRATVTTPRSCARPQGGRSHASRRSGATGVLDLAVLGRRVAVPLATAEREVMVLAAGGATPGVAVRLVSTRRVAAAEDTRFAGAAQ